MSEQLVMIGDLVPLGSEAETKLLGVTVHDQDQPLVDAIKNVASTSFVEVPDNASQYVVNFNMVRTFPSSHLGCLHEHRRHIGVVMSVVLKSSKNGIRVLFATVKSWVILDPVPGVDGESLLHLHKAAALDRTRVNPGGSLCDLVPPCVLPEVEVPRSGVHVVDLHGIEMIERNERISEVACRWVAKRSLDGSAFTDFFVDCHGHWVAAVGGGGILEESSPNQVEGRPDWDWWCWASRCGRSCSHWGRDEGRCTNLKSWALGLHWRWLRLRIDGSHDGQLEGSEVGLLLLLCLLLLLLEM